MKPSPPPRKQHSARTISWLTRATNCARRSTRLSGFPELLATPRLSPPDIEKQREYARIIHQSGQHLLAVVNSISNMSKIQSGALAIAREPFAVAPLIDLCCDMVKLHAKNSGVELLRAYPENLDEITGDRRACTQILVNLLSNAIKFTPANGTRDDQRPAGASIPPDSGGRYGHRNRRTRSRPSRRSVLSGQSLAGPARQRMRPWPVDRARPRRLAGGHDRGGERSRTREPASMSVCRSTAAAWPPRAGAPPRSKQSRACPDADRHDPTIK